MTEPTKNRKKELNMDQSESSSNSSADERTFLLNNELATVTNEGELVSTKRGFNGKLTFLPPADEVCEGFVFTGVCLSKEGGLHPAGGLHPGRSLYQGGGLHPGGWADPSPPHRILRDTVSEQAVRILLECTLVY